MNNDLEKIRHYQGTVADFKNFFDQKASETMSKPENTNAYDTPAYQGFDNVHPTRGSKKSPHWKMEENIDREVGHTDDEPSMIASDLRIIERYARELRELVESEGMKGETDFPHWWQSKIVKAKDYMVAAKHYLRDEVETSESIPTFENFLNEAATNINDNSHVL
jgi:hypothetical protein